MNMLNVLYFRSVVLAKRNYANKKLFCKNGPYNLKYLPWLPMCKRGIVEMLVTLNYMKYIRNIYVAMVFQLIGENYILLF